MDFFASLSPQEQPPRLVRQRSPVWIRPSSNVLPASIPGDSLLLHRPRVAASIDGLRVYPNALAFNVHVLYRGGRDLSRRPDGHSSSPFRTAVFSPGEPADLARALRLGVLYADGRRALAHYQLPRPPRDAEPEPPVMRPLSGHGNEGAWFQDFYIWGLPEEGPITIMYSWLDQDVPESRFEIDGDAVRAAADRIIVLWEDDGDEEDEQNEDGGDGKSGEGDGEARTGLKQ